VGETRRRRRFEHFFLDINYFRCFLVLESNFFLCSDSPVWKNDVNRKNDVIDIAAQRSHSVEKVAYCVFPILVIFWVFCGPKTE